MVREVRNPYRGDRWAEFRQELIELDGAACVKCGRTGAEGAVLQVHHKKYLAGKAPWEYPLELCETLCRRCHAAEHGQIPPVGGWEFVGEDDLGGLYGTCDLCHAELRHIFYVQHPDWPPMAVGTDCCDMLTGTKIASEIRKHDSRLKRFKESPRWEEVGGCHFITQKRIDIQIFPAEGGYRIRMNSTKGKATYPDLDAAKGRVFDFIESGEADAFFKNKS
jgi:hypothetical protein